jgi:hypothetical protein
VEAVHAWEWYVHGWILHYGNNLHVEAVYARKLCTCASVTSEETVRTQKWCMLKSGAYRMVHTQWIPCKKHECAKVVHMINQLVTE